MTSTLPLFCGGRDDGTDLSGAETQGRSRCCRRGLHTVSVADQAHEHRVQTLGDGYGYCVAGLQRNIDRSVGAGEVIELNRPFPAGQGAVEGERGRAFGKGAAVRTEENTTELP